MILHTRTVIVASTALAAMVWLAAPLGAQRSQGGDGSRSRSERGGSDRAGRTEPRSAPAPAPRQAAPQSNRGYSSAQPPRQNIGPSAQAPSQARSLSDQRNYGPRVQAAPRQLPYPQANVYRGTTSSRYGYAPQGSYQAPRGYVQERAVPYRSYSSRSYGPRLSVFSRPYYTFRPRFSLGFGISVGYGVAYPFQYYDPYASYNYGIGVLPGYGTNYSAGYSSYSSRVGGLSFDIDPIEAAVFIDGQYVGVAADFAADQMPLTLSVGRHHIDLRADGFMTASFDLTIVGGQVIPYQGTMSTVQ